MNLRHIDPRSTEWMETIEEMIAREDGDEEDSKTNLKTGSARGTGGRLASGGAPDHAAMTASAASSAITSRR